MRLSQRLLAQYDKEMTIVLQNQFWDLKVTETGFEVGLSFDGQPEMLGIPFSALKGFFDPSVQFGMQFDAERTAQTPSKQAAPRIAENAAAAVPDPTRNPSPRAKRSSASTASARSPERLEKRSLTIAGHRTSIALEPEFWAGLEAMAVRRGQAADSDDRRNRRDPAKPQPLLSRPPRGLGWYQARTGSGSPSASG